MSRRSRPARKGLEANPDARIPGVISINEIYRLDEAKLRLGWPDAAYRAEIEGYDKAVWLDAAMLPTLDEIRAGRGRPVLTTLLSPFDNLVIRRERVNKLFGYDYTLECYLPEPKRKFGYFCLPILYKGNFAAQLDPKADRATGIFHVKNFHVQQRTADKPFFEKLNGAIQEFAAFNGCDTVKVDATVPLKMRKLLRGS